MALRLVGHAREKNAEAIERRLRLDETFEVKGGTYAEVLEFANGFQRVKVVTGPKAGQIGWLPLDFCRALNEVERARFEEERAAKK